MESQSNDPKTQQQQQSKPPSPIVCQECNLNASKYKCPGCCTRSCSLPCVNSHKKRTGCNGKRKLVEFLPISHFDDDVLLSDYNLLEDIKRVAESSERMRLKVCGAFHYGLPYHLKNLKKIVGQRRTRLLFLYKGMSKRELNQTFYNTRNKSIYWTIEWRFHSTDVTLIDHRVHENSTFLSVIEKHLQPGPWGHKLKKFCLEPLDSLKLLIRINPKGPRSPFRELDMHASIRQQLADLVIMEYPVIHVFLPTQRYNFEVIKAPVPRKIEPKEPASSSQTSPKGVFFREEEIQDDLSPDPQVLDLMKYSKSQTSLPETKSSDEPDGLVVSSLPEDGKQMKDELCIDKSEFSHSLSSPRKQDLEISVEDYDFEQGLKDAYSDLVSEINPDDFFDFEGDLDPDKEMEELRDQIDYSGVFAEDELEEGEIPEFDN